MKHKKVLLASLLAASGFAGQSAYAVTTDWVGTADYTGALNSANDEDVVGPFSTYDAGAGVVLLEVGSVAGPVTSFSDRDYVAMVYAKGPLFFDAVRARIGDQAFFAALRDYVAQNAYRQADAAGFFEIVRQNTTQELSVLISKYFK